MKPKIVFTVINDLTSDQRMQRICRTLSEEEFEITLVGRRLRGSAKLEQFSFNAQRLNCFFNKGFLFYLEYNLRLFIYLFRSKPDILGAVDADTFLAHYFTALFIKKPIVFDAHEFFSQVPEVLGRSIVQKIWERIETLAFNKSEIVYTVGEGLAKIFTEKFKKSVEVVRNLPEREHFNLSVPRNIQKKIILYQGALNLGRGLENAIQAMQWIDAELHIIGKGDIENELKILVKKLDLNHKVKFLGFKRPVELKEISRTAFIGYNVSENLGLSYYFSLNNKFFDYVQASLPSVINDFPEYRRYNEETEVGILIKDSSPESIAKACNELLNNRDLYFRLKENCLFAAKKWCWENESPKLIALYKKVIAKNS